MYPVNDVRYLSNYLRGNWRGISVCLQRIPLQKNTGASSKEYEKSRKVSGSTNVERLERSSQHNIVKSDSANILTSFSFFINLKCRNNYWNF